MMDRNKARLTSKREHYQGEAVLERVRTWAICDRVSLTLKESRESAGEEFFETFYLEVRGQSETAQFQMHAGFAEDFLAGLSELIEQHKGLRWDSVADDREHDHFFAKMRRELDFDA